MERRGGATRRGRLRVGAAGPAGPAGLAACARGATPGAGGGGQESAAPVEISFTLPGAAGLEQELYTGFMNDFHARQSKIKVSYAFEPDFNAYPAKLRALLAADT